MKRFARHLGLGLVTAVVCLSFPAWAQDPSGAQGDIGTPTKSDLERVHPSKPPYSPDMKRFGTKPLPETTMMLQERAYTSPIWYTP